MFETWLLLEEIQFSGWMFADKQYVEYTSTSEMELKGNKNRAALVFTAGPQCTGPMCH